MSEEAVKEAPKPEAKPGDKSKAGAPAEGAGKGGMMGPLAAVVLLVGLGVGVGMYLGSTLAAAQAAGTDPAVIAKADAHAADAHGGAHGDGAKGNSLAGLHEINLNDLVANIRNKDGRRYVKVSCAIWVAHEDVEKIVPPAAGDGHGAAAENETIKRILRMKLEEHLRTYDLEELTTPHIDAQLQAGFREKIEKELHAIYTDVGADYRFVRRVVAYGLLVQ